MSNANLMVNFNCDTSKAIEKIEKAKNEGLKLEVSDFNIDIEWINLLNLKAVIS